MLVLLCACEPSVEVQRKVEERKRIECLDRLCEGDVLPKVADDQSLMKLGGQFFVVPRIYGGFDAVLGFYWPSRTPINSPDRDRTAPEFNSIASGRQSSDQEVAINIFLRTTDLTFRRSSDAFPRNFGTDVLGGCSWSRTRCPGRQGGQAPGAATRSASGRRPGRCARAGADGGAGPD